MTLLIVSSPSGSRVPVGTCVSRTLQPALVTLKPSEVKWTRLTLLAPISSPVSAQTASNTAVESVPRATSVATRRSAACSSARSRRSSRAWEVRDRRRDQFGEAGEASLGVGRQFPLFGGECHHHAPRPAVHQNRDADGGADPRLTGERRGDRPPDFGVVANAGRS